LTREEIAEVALEVKTFFTRCQDYSLSIAVGGGG